MEKKKITDLKSYKNKKLDRLVGEVQEILQRDRQSYIRDLMSLPLIDALEILYNYDLDAQEPDPYFSLFMIISDLKQYHYDYYVELVCHESGVMEEVISKVAKWITRQKYDDDV